MTNRFICIHGHFYQPPRENPWLEDVEVEDSAAPYHDWNERVTAECYAPNAVARILDGGGQIIELVSNYAKMSFNFGPTLMSWLERHRSEVYKQILEADRITGSQNGHGNAIAQCYNHAIMPLASERQKLTQVRWGIADFRHRFGRDPEGLWLAETAVDLPSLQVLADHGIRFTILAPHQAEAVRAPGEDWHDVSNRSIDPTRAYFCRLANGRHINLFFYDEPVSRDLSFEGLLRSGDRFAERLAGSFNGRRDHAQLVSVATDGETFGHHFKFGEMALAYAMRRIEREGLGRMTTYAEFLALYPPTHEVKICQNTSWSCSHGVERWRSDCGCNSGNTDYHQRWRAPLRQSLDWLRAKLDIVFEHEGSSLLADPWAAFDDYIGVILDRSLKSRGAFLEKHARHDLSKLEQVNTWRLLEMQRHAELMYTSCGWFFDDISNIETVKNIEYAARSIQLAREAAGVDLEAQFVAHLATATGSQPHLADGAAVYETLVRPSIANLEKGLAHYGISSLVEEYAPEQRIFSFEFERRDYHREKTSARTLAVGAVDVRSEITCEELAGLFVVLHLGGYDFHCLVRERASDKAYNEFKEKIFRVFNEDSTRNLLLALDDGVECESFALKDLFNDERRKIGRLLLGDALERSRDHYRRIYEESRDVMRLLATMKIPAPEGLKHAVEYVLSQRLEQASSDLRADAQSQSSFPEVTAAILREAESLGCRVDLTSVANALERVVSSTLIAYGTHKEPAFAEGAAMFLRLAEQLGVRLEKWELQNLFWVLLTSTEHNGAAAPAIRELGERLRFGEAIVEARLNVKRVIRAEP
jgi:alpha-amylase/alpha-mannosidase (GH57 family)